MKTEECLDINETFCEKNTQSVVRILFLGCYAYQWKVSNEKS